MALAPARIMNTEIASAGFYELDWRRYSPLQFITIEQVLKSWLFTTRLWILKYIITKFSGAGWI
jgi:hypothetical protein